MSLPDRTDTKSRSRDSLTSDKEKLKDDNGAEATFDILAADEQEHDIKLRTMSWQRCALLLFGDQVCLAIMAQAWSFKVLGWVPGLLTTFLSGMFFWITSYTMWQYIMKVRSQATCNRNF